jgi:hypothetical protein
LKEGLHEYLEEKFPDLGHEIHVRFELGEPFANGTEERLNQVYHRVTSIFESVFNDRGSIYMLIKDSEQIDPMFGNTTPNYLYELLKNQPSDSEILTEVIEDEDVDGNPVSTEVKVKHSVLLTTIGKIDYKRILEGIANYEQGREPSIGQSVYFIDNNRDIIFYMYDDRGCIVFSDSTPKIRYLYERYNDWIVDYWRSHIDQLFKK